MSINRLGTRLMRKQAVVKPSLQKQNRTEACASNVSPVLTRCRCYILPCHFVDVYVGMKHDEISQV
jgi:hypothetical protein